MTRREIVLSLILCAVLLAAWQWGLQALAVPTYIFPNLSAVFAELVPPAKWLEFGVARSPIT